MEAYSNMSANIDGETANVRTSISDSFELAA